MKRHLLNLLLVVMGLSLLFTAGTLHTRLQSARRAYRLSHAEPLENAPPLVVFSTVALGGFSGIIADMLWMRAGQLQMDGQYFELVQLADWITKLQPRFPEGWVYHAWNLSYNISVMFDAPEDRWRWVRHGVELLRDGGLRYNPANPDLHRELGWLFQHKMGGSTDQAHVFYKHAWATEMQRLFEGRSPDYDRFARTPASRRDLLLVSGMPDLVASLRAAGFEPFDYMWPAEEEEPGILRIIADHAAGDVLLDHFRLRILVDRYKLIPDRMRRVEEEVGPVDWRLPNAHAIYWAWSGLPYAEDFAALSLRRMIFQNMSEAFRMGRLVMDEASDLFIPSPNPDIAPYVMRAYIGALEEHGDRGAVGMAFLNFLNHAITVLYTYHRMADARMVFEELERWFPDQVEGRTLDQYVLAQFVEQIADLSDYEALSFVEASFYQSAFWEFLGEHDRATGYARLAQRAWHDYMAPRMGHAEWRERTGLPPLAQIRDNARETAQAVLQQHRERAR